MVVVLIQMPYVATTSVTAVQTDTHATKIKAIVSPMCRPSKARTFPLLIFNLRETTLQVRALLKLVLLMKPVAILGLVNSVVVPTLMPFAVPISATAVPTETCATLLVDA